MRENGILGRSSDDADIHTVTSAFNYVEEFIKSIKRIEEETEIKEIEDDE
jgi:hypothetical protein